MQLGRVERAGVFAALLLYPACTAPPAASQFAVSPASAYSIPTSILLQPEELNRILETSGVEKPLVLYVGSRVLFDQAHVPHSEYVGPASQAAGLNALRDRLIGLPLGTFVVIYCGCCPWDRCPNVGPAYRLLADTGFTRVRVLYIADNFGVDWVKKGLPVESTH